VFGEIKLSVANANFSVMDWLPVKSSVQKFEVFISWIWRVLSSGMWCYVVSYI
jgi:hypothetical protein